MPLKKQGDKRKEAAKRKDLINKEERSAIVSQFHQKSARPRNPRAIYSYSLILLLEVESALAS